LPTQSIEQLQIAYVINGKMQENQVYCLIILAEVRVIIIMA